MAEDLATILKKQAAVKAVELVESGMVLGLGTGSTAAIAVDLIGAKVQSGQLKNIVGVPTSKATTEQARALGISLGTLADYNHLKFGS